MTVLVTGGAGFIGSNFILHWLAAGRAPIVNLDSMTYAANTETLTSLQGDSDYTEIVGDICDRPLVDQLLAQHRPKAIVHFAAESHVDRSIVGPDAFVRTNVTGTFTLLDAARKYWGELPHDEKDAFRFLHVSTDEVYGSLNATEPPFTEQHPYRPNSPYAASKAAADHLARAWFHTYDFPVVTSNCSNNYGPRQFPEKLIPLLITNALAGKPLPIYGDGQNVRDWLFVGDHCEALRVVLERGVPGETYNVGGYTERTNLEIVRLVCATLDRLQPAASSYAKLITFVQDRPGHDRRYAIDATKIERELGWRPAYSFEAGIVETIEWYLQNGDWLKAATAGSYREWTASNYANRGKDR